MKRFRLVVLLCVILFWVAPAFGGQQTVLPSVVKSVVQNLDFFAQPWALRGYESCFLYDVNRLTSERIGVILISPSGFEIRLVYDVNSLAVVYMDTLLSEKSRREAMRHESISVADAIKVARNALKFSKGMN